MRKVGVIKRLMVSAHGEEIKFIIRSLQGKLRVGLADQSIISALAQAVVLTPPSTTLPPPILDASLKSNPTTLQNTLVEATNLLKQVISECPSYNAVVPALLSYPLSELPDHCHLSPGIPVHPMLAKPTQGISEVLDRLQDNTHKYPDLISTLQNCISSDVTSCILDSECVAWDRQSGRILPFQILSTRARKEVKEEDVKIHVVIFVFDILFFNGEVRYANKL